MKISFIPFVIGELGFRDFLKKQPSCRELPATTSSSGFIINEMFVRRVGTSTQQLRTSLHVSPTLSDDGNLPLVTRIDKMMLKALKENNFGRVPIKCKCAS